MTHGRRGAERLPTAADSDGTTGFRPAWWLPNAHAQTIWAARFRRPPKLALTSWPVSLADGDALETLCGPPRPGPLVLILHGLAGSARSGYVLGLMRALTDAGMQAIAMQYRGIGARPERPRRLYHAGAWEDAAAVAGLARRRFPGRPLAAVGFSLGGSIVINWLANAAASEQPDCACIVSTPFELGACADAIDRGFSRLYQADLLRSLKAIYRNVFPDPDAAPLAAEAVRSIATLRGFDDRITAPLHGFSGATDYYQRASPGRQLCQVRRPCLILQAEDDPFVPRDTLPDPADLPRCCRLELQRHGGHVGFVAGDGLRARYWAETRVTRYLLAAPALR